MPDNSSRETICNEVIMEEQYDKKIIVVASLCTVVCGGVYYAFYAPSVMEQTVLTTNVAPAIGSEVQDNIEEKKRDKLIMLVYLKN